MVAILAEGPLLGCIASWKHREAWQRMEKLGFLECTFEESKMLASTVGYYGLLLCGIERLT